MEKLNQDIPYFLDESPLYFIRTFDPYPYSDEDEIKCICKITYRPDSQISPFFYQNLTAHNDDAYLRFPKTMLIGAIIITEEEAKRYLALEVL